MSNAPLSQLVISAELAMNNSDFVSAARDFQAATLIKENDPYLIQQYALATYKSKQPTPVEALKKAREIIHQLHPEHTDDCETMGIAAAIHKKLWLIEWNADDIKQAVEYYGRGFIECKNYHCGENYALCLNLQASIETNIARQYALNESAKKVREQLVVILDKIAQAPDFEDKPDKKWVLATMANCLFALGRTEEGHFYEAILYLEKEDVFNQWQRDTYEFEKLQLLKLLNTKSSTSYRYLQ